MVTKVVAVSTQNSLYFLTLSSLIIISYYYYYYARIPAQQRMNYNYRFLLLFQILRILHLQVRAMRKLPLTSIQTPHFFLLLVSRLFSIDFSPVLMNLKVYHNLLPNFRTTTITTAVITATTVTTAATTIITRTFPKIQLLITPTRW